MTINDIEEFIAAAEQHGKDSEPDHEVGDLQDLLRVAWRLLNPYLQSQLMQSQPVLSLEELMED